MAGAGLEIVPWAARTVPCPTPIALQLTESMPSTSSAAHEPTMSMIASREPTSCSSTSSAAMPWSAPSASASAVNTANDRDRTRSGRSAAARIALISRNGRCVCPSAWS